MKKTSLIIFDGLGLSDIKPEENAFKQAETPNFDKLLRDNNYSSLKASGKAVGILEGQIGNSEVGHLTIGSGRITKQSIVEINDLFDNNEFKDIESFKESVEHAFQYKSKIHVIGLVGAAGVHGVSKHLTGVLDIIPEDIEVCYHLISDGRDSDYKSSIDDIRELQNVFSKYKKVVLSSLSGRYFAMDRDNNWERIEKVYNVIFNGINTTPLSPLEYVTESYSKGCYDEFIKPVLFEGGETIKENDVVFFMNYRSDRARQLTQAITGEGFFGGFPLACHKNIFFVSMTKYYEEYSGNVFVERNFLKNTLPEVLEQNSCTQLHLAETEKFAHVTKFFSGGKHIVYKGQKDILVPSLKVSTYDMTPEMSAGAILDKFLSSVLDYDFSVVNFANPDMIGHTGCMSCTVESLEYLDTVLGKILDFAFKNNIELILAADHGNCETMGTNINPHTAHTTNLVPCVYVSDGKTVKLKKQGGLRDIAPTILEIMNIKKPDEMSGSSLINLD